MDDAGLSGAGRGSGRPADGSEPGAPGCGGSCGRGRRVGAAARGNPDPRSRVPRGHVRGRSRAPWGAGARHRGPRRQRRAGALREGGPRPRKRSGVRPGRRAQPLAREIRRLPGRAVHRDPVSPAGAGRLRVRRARRRGDRARRDLRHAREPSRDEAAAPWPPTTPTYRGAVYEGGDYREFDPASSEEDRLKWGWSTLDARASFWPTRESLLELLRSSGFTSLHETLHAPWLGMPEDRITLVGVSRLR